ncbi:hypothetical protein [Rhodoferax sp. PAMC 29310]|uniref:hypothetical protein n=1 Tax=Rhodoferax sp. PAMC 29310 TaxID=2822760 RepID=UPI001B327067|nr:hypothetical protein [Rhodoferax sp. PAMC 29310]
MRQFLHSYASLNELAGLENPISEILSSWIWQRIQPGLPWVHYRVRDCRCDTACIPNSVLEKTRTALPQLYRIDLFETYGSGLLGGPQLPLPTGKGR